MMRTEGPPRTAPVAGGSSTGEERQQLLERVFALQPILQRRFSDELSRELDDELHHVTIHQLAALHHLSEGICSMRELARTLSISESSATAAADRLVREGLVERRADPADRRLVLLALTDEGRAFVERVRRARALKTSRMLSVLSDRQLAQLVEIYETLRDAPTRATSHTDHETEGARA
jgi:DNA-binding MarR family transcriptional regulator